MLAADLVLTNGNVLPLTAPGARAEAVAVRDGRIVHVGDVEAVMALAGPGTKVVDLGGWALVPGFCDAHVHLASYGLNLLHIADVRTAATIDEILAIVADHAGRTASEWVLARGFDQETLAERRMPTRADLDRVSRVRPILLTRVCGHAVVANSAALARLTDGDLAGGDPESGLFTEERIAPLYRAVPDPTGAEVEEGILRACADALAQGITSVGCIIDAPEQIGAFTRLHRAGRLPIRVTMMPPYRFIAALHECGIGTTFGDEVLKFGGAKLFSDGSLGARTALLSAPYADDRAHADNRGVRNHDPADLSAYAADAQAKGFQAVIHAIGDQANRETLAALVHALGADGDNAYHRHRIEHASLLEPDVLETMAARQILAVVQPQFVHSDTWMPDRIGPERARRIAYPFQRMLAAGIPLALSSDAPVEPIDSFACIDAAVQRPHWSPDEGLTPEQALRAYCYGGAYALHADAYLGTLEPGKAADLAVLSADPTSVAAGARWTVEQAYLAGRLAFGGRDVQPGEQGGANQTESMRAI